MPSVIMAVCNRKESLHTDAEEISQEKVEPLAQYRIRVMSGRNFIIAVYHFLSSARIFQYFTNCPHHFLGQETVHNRQIELLRLNIPDKDTVAVNQKGFTKVYCL